MNGYCCTCAYGVEVPQEPYLMCKNPDSKYYNDRVDAYLRCKKYMFKGSNDMNNAAQNDNVCCDTENNPLTPFGTRHERKDKLLRKAMDTMNIQLRTLYNQGYKDGREDGYDSGYRAGHEMGCSDHERIGQCEQSYGEGFEAGTERLWNLLRSIVKIPISQRSPVFGEMLPENAVPTLFALLECMDVDKFMGAAMEYIEQSEKKNPEKQEKQTAMDTNGFRLGDEATYEGRKFIILGFHTYVDGTVIAGGVGTGKEDKLCVLDSWDFCAVDQLKKTGKHFDHVEELLRMVSPNEKPGEG